MHHLNQHSFVVLTKEYMGKLSNIFYEAYSNMNYNHEYAIEMYSKEIDQNAENFIAWNNRGVTKIYSAISKKDSSLIDDATKDFETSIKLANEYDGKGFEGAKKNIEWAKKIKTTFEEDTSVQ